MIPDPQTLNPQTPISNSRIPIPNFQETYGYLACIAAERVANRVENQITSSKSSESTNASPQKGKDRPHPGSVQIINRSGHEKDHAIESWWCKESDKAEVEKGIARKWRVPLIFLIPFCPPPTLEDSFGEFTSMLKQNLYVYPQHTYICAKQ